MGLVLYSQGSDGVDQITFNDPDNLNAMGEDMAHEWSERVAQLANEKRRLRAIIISGAGRAFSAGGHLDMLDKKRLVPGEENRLRMLSFYHSFLGIRSLGVPLIAAINGHAVGAGLCLATACDIRIAAPEAKLGFTFTKLGLHPGMGATYFLRQVIGTSRATELLITGRLITADESLRIGLLSEVVSQGSVAERARVLASEILECGPESVRQVLESMRNEPQALEACLEREALCQSVNYASPEFADRITAAKLKSKR